MPTMVDVRSTLEKLCDAKAEANAEAAGTAQDEYEEDVISPSAAAPSPDSCLAIPSHSATNKVKHARKKITRKKGKLARK